MRSPPSLRHWRIGGNPVPFGTGTWRRRLRPRDGDERERGDAMRCGRRWRREEGGIKLSDSRLNNQRARPCTTTARSLVDTYTWRTRLAGLFVRLLMASSYQQPFPLFFLFLPPPPPPPPPHWQTTKTRARILCCCCCSQGYFNIATTTTTTNTFHSSTSVLCGRGTDCGC